MRQIPFEDVYYALRRRLGMEELDAERIRKQKLLHPEADPAEELGREDHERVKQLVLCLAVLLVLTAAVAGQNTIRQLTVLTRPGYGETAREQTLHTTVEERSYQIPVIVDSRVYTDAEKETLFGKAWESAQAKALADNPDWDHVSHDLVLEEETDVPGFYASWHSTNVDLVGVDGAVYEPEDDADHCVELTCVILYEQEEREYSVQARILPPDLSAEQREERDLKEALEEALAEDREAAEVALPETLHGEPIVYTEEAETLPIWLIPALGILFAAALWTLPEQRRREELTRRDRELALAYSELVWKLTVLLGAGMTVKGAWARILDSYHEKRRGGGEPEILYEEMQITWNLMSQGTYEEKAYARFGRRCGLPPYLRLGSLLETNVRQGRKGLAVQMQSEAEAAFRERLQLAKRQGEEASSRLLMPMMLLFGLVLVILMVPALSQFG